MLKFLTHIAQVTPVNNPFPQVSADTSSINIFLNILFVALGSVALLFIVIGGFRYIVSGGEPQSTARAKDTIIYAVVGLVIVLSATAIVNYITGKL